ncbi:MAG: lipoprotein [Pseudobdellovibrionaceae bacterium]
MKKIFLALSAIVVLSACGKLNEMLDTPEKMDGMKKTMGEMNGGMKKTTNGIHDQTLAVSLEQLMDSKNWDVLTPVPLKMIPWGRKFAEEATAQEVIEYTYLVLKEITDSKRVAGTDLEMNDIPYDLENILPARTEKLAKLMALRIIAGFIQEEKLTEIISTHILGKGGEGSLRFEDTAYVVLAMRAEFLSDVLLDNSVLATPLKNVGIVEEAIEMAEKLDRIGKLSFVERVAYDVPIKMKVNTGAEVQTMEFVVSYKVKGDKIADTWKRIQVGIETDLKVDSRSVGSNEAENKKLAASEAARAKKANARVAKYLKSWE